LGQAHQHGQGLAMELAPEIGPMHLDGFLGSAQIKGDLFIELAGDRQLEDLALPGGQGGDTFLQVLDLLPLPLMNFKQRLTCQSLLLSLNRQKLRK
jgi:hypothetical protein